MQTLSYLYGDAPVYIVKYTEATYPKWHSHDFWEIQYVTSGRGYHFVGNEQIDVKPGDVFLTSFGVSHCFVSRKNEDPLLVTNAVFCRETLEKLPIDLNEFSEIGSDILYTFAFKDDASVPAYLRVYDDAFRIRKLMELVEEEHAQKAAGFIDMLILYVSEMLIAFLRLYSAQTQDNAVIDAQREYTREVLEYIKYNYTQKITLGQLAAIAMMSPNHLCTVFKNMTGKTISEYIQEMRLENICNMLRETNIPFTEIAHKNGYEGRNFLQKLFIKTYGMTPGAYRRAAREKKD